MQEKLSAEEKQRKTIEQELVKLKKSAPEDDKEFEVSCLYVFTSHSFLLLYGLILSSFTG